jgi:hypothetical protein
VLSRLIGERFDDTISRNLDGFLSECVTKNLGLQTERTGVFEISIEQFVTEDFRVVAACAKLNLYDDLVGVAGVKGTPYLNGVLHGQRDLL